MIHLTLAVSEFLLMVLGAFAWAAASVAGWLVAGGAMLWGCWRLLRRK